ncbi:MAG: hypothetical protein AAGG68_28415 [Bacteroidota bacterium]
MKTASYKLLLPFTLFIVLTTFVSQKTQAQVVDSLGIRIKVFPYMAFNPSRPYLKASLEFLFFKEKLGLELGYGRRYADIAVEKEFRPIDFKGNSFLLSLNLYNLSPNEHKEWRNYISIGYRYLDDLSSVSKVYRNVNDRTLDLETDYFRIIRKLNIWSVQIGTLHMPLRLGLQMGIELGIQHKKQSFVENELEQNENYDRMGCPFCFSHLPREINGLRPSRRIAMTVIYKLL